MLSNVTLFISFVLVRADPSGARYVDDLVVGSDTLDLIIRLRIGSVFRGDVYALRQRPSPELVEFSESAVDVLDLKAQVLDAQLVAAF